MPVVEFHVDDVVELRKPHPCGGAQWTVVRLGADIGLKCGTCERRLALPRRTLERRLKRFVRRAAVNTVLPPEQRGGARERRGG